MSITFLSGPAGTGKTTQAVERLRELLSGHVPGHNILVIVPQLTLAQPYRTLLRDPGLPGASSVDVLTLNGLALKIIDLFWPLGAASGQFERPHQPPIFLTIETAQYYLRQAIDPLLREGYFDPNVVTSLTISLPRLMSQILDNLNKAALIGLPHTQVAGRLAASLSLEPGGGWRWNTPRPASTAFATTVWPAICSIFRCASKCSSSSCGRWPGCSVI